MLGLWPGCCKGGLCGVGLRRGREGRRKDFCEGLGRTAGYGAAGLLATEGNTTIHTDPPPVLVWHRACKESSMARDRKNQVHRKLGTALVKRVLLPTED